MDNICNYIFILGPALIDFIILIWWRYSCTSDFTIKFPTKGHILLCTLISLIPILGIIISCLLLGSYIGFRVTGNIHLKPNKFNKFWFDVEDE